MRTVVSLGPATKSRNIEASYSQREQRSQAFKPAANVVGTWRVPSHDFLRQDGQNCPVPAIALITSAEVSVVLAVKLNASCLRDA